MRCSNFSEKAQHALTCSKWHPLTDFFSPVKTNSCDTNTITTTYGSYMLHLFIDEAENTSLSMHSPGHVQRLIKGLAEMIRMLVLLLLSLYLIGFVERQI